MLLLERDIIPTSELAERLEVSRRTVFRDIESLSMAGLPIVISRGSAGGVGLMKSFKVDKKLFTPKDIQQLISGLKSYHQLLANRETAHTMTKLQSLMKDTEIGNPRWNNEFVTVDLAPNRGNQSLRSLLNVIDRASNDKLYLLFRYIDKSGFETDRKAEPYLLVYKESHWYLQAYCEERQNYRVFKLARMSEVRISEEKFSPRNFAPLPMDGSEWMKQDMVCVTIKIDKSIKEKVVERFGEDHIVARHDNHYIAKYSIADNEEGYNALLNFGHKCEVLEPASIRRKFIEYLQRITGIYGDNK